MASTRAARQLRRGLLVFATLGGCAPPGCGAIENSGGTPAAPTAETPLAVRGEPAATHPLPTFNPEALNARVQAQRSVLGAGANLFEDERGQPLPWLSPQDVSPPEEVAFDEALLDSLPGSSGLGGDGAYVGPRVNGNMLGLYEPISPNSSALTHFYGALRELQQGDDPARKVRVVVYGASHTEADVFPHYLRTYLRERFGDGGHGFVHVAQPWRGYSQIEVTVEGFDHWYTDHAQRRDGRKDGLFGLLGASIAAKTKRAWGRITPARDAVASRYELSFLRQPKGGRFELWVDGQRHEVVSTRAKSFEPGYYQLALPEDAHVLEVRLVGDGEVRLWGLTAERDQPGIVVDTLGIRGTRAANILEWDERIWADTLRRRRPDLYILAYGTNEATDERSIESYEINLRGVLSRFAQVAPQASCLLVGPGDFPATLDDGTLTSRPRVSEIIASQERVAIEFGCGFWDFRAFMGGELSMAQWMNALPPMAARDHVHLTRRGYTRMGMALADAIMMPFDDDDPLAPWTGRQRPAELGRESAVKNPG